MDGVFTDNVVYIWCKDWAYWQTSVAYLHAVIENHAEVWHWILPMQFFKTCAPNNLTISRSQRLLLYHWTWVFLVGGKAHPIILKEGGGGETMPPTMSPLLCHLCITVYSTHYYCLNASQCTYIYICIAGWLCIVTGPIITLRTIVTNLHVCST